MANNSSVHMAYQGSAEAEAEASVGFRGHSEKQECHVRA